MTWVRKFTILLPCLLVSLAAIGRPAIAAGDMRLFGTVETRSVGLGMFKKWQGVLVRYLDERKLPDEPCSSSLFNSCHLKEWKEFLAEQKGRDKRSQIEAVNNFMNRQRYLTDPRNYNDPDYWATPAQFLNRDGDCEDYAIAKFMSLRALGFSNDELRIVVVQDLNLRLGHAILAVYLDGDALILDNQVRQVVRSASIHHYKPIYSINEQYWWLHRQQ